MFGLGLLGVCWPSGLFHLVCLPLVFLPSKAETRVLCHKRAVAVVRTFPLLYVCLVCWHWRRSFPSSILRPAVTTIRAKLNCSKCTVSLRILHARMYARIITIHLHLLCQGKSHIPPRLRCAWTHSRPWAPRCRRDFHNEHVVLSC